MGERGGNGRAWMERSGDATGDAQEGAMDSWDRDWAMGEGGVVGRK